MDGPCRPENRITLEPFPAAELALQATALAAAVGAAVQSLAAWLAPIVEEAEASIARSDLQVRIQRFGVWLKEAQRRVKAVDAPGYTPYFERMGQSGFSARFHAGVVRYFAGRFHAESQERRVALMAFHSLARRRRWHPALARQVAVLYDHSRDADILDDAFRDAGCPELKGEFVILLQRAPEGDRSRCPRLLEISARIAPHAPRARGRPSSLDSALHQALLRWSRNLGGRQGYTFGLVRGSTRAREDFVDDATAATRIELRRPSFNPISARRAVKAHLARESEREAGPT